VSLPRTPSARDRLSRLDDGRLLYRLKHRWRDGTTHVVFAPQELLEKLAALAPPPRFHLVRYHGALGPCASLRDRIVPAGQGVRRTHSTPSPEFDATPARVDGEPASAASAATPDPASVERLGSTAECELLASPSAIPAREPSRPRGVGPGQRAGAGDPAPAAPARRDDGFDDEAADQSPADLAS